MGADQLDGRVQVRAVSECVTGGRGEQRVRREEGRRAAEGLALAGVGAAEAADPHRCAHDVHVGLDRLHGLERRVSTYYQVVQY